MGKLGRPKFQQVNEINFAVSTAWLNNHERPIAIAQSLVLGPDKIKDVLGMKPRKVQKTKR